MLVQHQSNTVHVLIEPPDEKMSVSLMPSWPHMPVFNPRSISCPFSRSSQDFKLQVAISSLQRMCPSDCFDHMSQRTDSSQEVPMASSKIPSTTKLAVKQIGLRHGLRQPTRTSRPVTQVWNTERTRRACATGCQHPQQHPNKARHNPHENNNC
jgi:hypothetical protein